MSPSDAHPPAEPNPLNLPNLSNLPAHPLVGSAFATRCAAWFALLRDQICAEFERLEDECPLALAAGMEAGRFERKAWQRQDIADAGDGNLDKGGGIMAVMRGGRVFDKVGVNISTVYGQFSANFAAQIPGADHDPRFYASGISLVAHPRSPKLPIAHMNTRLVATSKQWFGGGGDLTPIFVIDRDRDDFHAAFRAACDAHNPEYYAKYKTWCDEYFFIKHRGEARGVGGIFYDYLNSGDIERDFAFTQDVGRCFAEIYPAILRRHLHEAWDDSDIERQRIKRGRYVEFNLIYDRGTVFGLKTGGNIEAILMSLPPLAAWP
ncbi:MAG: oxygen-dependent coproporphyrinogen oxidase [Candidatus Symbiobacter sp.]|nr:oxygen-dependent coproporphyrinogen oxidase [Candidatus Symbiobacter sp.]